MNIEEKLDHFLITFLTLKSSYLIEKSTSRVHWDHYEIRISCSFQWCKFQVDLITRKKWTELPTFLSALCFGLFFPRFFCYFRDGCNKHKTAFQYVSELSFFFWKLEKSKIIIDKRKKYCWWMRPKTIYKILYKTLRATDKKYLIKICKYI